MFYITVNWKTDESNSPLQTSLGPLSLVFEFTGQ